jgi:hypothetical protein
MMKRLILSTLLLFAACSGGNTKDVQGTVKSADPLTFNIPSAPTPTISIMGRDETEFVVEFVETTLNGPEAQFIIRDVPQKQPLVFEIHQLQMDSIITFPIDIKTTANVTIPALPSGTVDNITEEIEALPGGVGVGGVDTSAGVILGQIKSGGGGCGSIQSVSIKDKQSGQPATVTGPYYFDSDGHVVNNGQMSDGQCNYVMVNVLAGVYTVEFNDAGASKIAEHEVLVLGSNVSFGMDIPSL